MGGAKKPRLSSEAAPIAVKASGLQFGQFEGAAGSSNSSKTNKRQFDEAFGDDANNNTGATANFGLTSTSSSLKSSALGTPTPNGSSNPLSQASPPEPVVV